MDDLNRIARKVVSAYNITILDLNALVHSHCGATYSDCDWCRKHPCSYHYNPVGESAQADAVAAAFRTVISENGVGIGREAKAVAEEVAATGPTAAVAPAPAPAPAPATVPPRGWNSYDSFTKNVNETEFLSNCQAMADLLLPSGYDTCVIDYLWYEPEASDGSSWYLDEYCRPVPDPARWPSSAGGLGFKPVADKVHAMGLKFGIHIMRGTSTFAQAKNCEIKGSKVHIKDIIATDSGAVCPWKSASLGVDMSKSGSQAFYDSLYEQYALDWE